MDTIFDEMAERWKSPAVAREQITVFSGGMMEPKYLANLDSQGKGPEGRFYCGRKVCYPTRKLTEWLKSRSKPIPERHRTE